MQWLSKHFNCGVNFAQHVFYMFKWDEFFAVRIWFVLFAFFTQCDVCHSIKSIISWLYSIPFFSVTMLFLAVTLPIVNCLRRKKRTKCNNVFIILMFFVVISNRTFFSRVYYSIKREFQKWREKKYGNIVNETQWYSVCGVLSCNVSLAPTAMESQKPHLTTKKMIIVDANGASISAV